ncbi:hypothetical protein SPRG_13185 [Saprolegnia parasitica CBS 223.65]|uniref:Uncharacterized protein n=1 Tax=Saprolegnia parasitica (strain CBS 223.65) TaxID=695850 RepID=A0A067C5F6_SAPPC|nr:hypothetical protein SPRG_13185 [Saprolegnia parasitica CBS 223.65]KDO21771.1 hypothetical protein SPRG_13185 [Saprolegnia parasitica CBS 223.65]|eukprot:XP_012207571.1 hypothetical protein SPRG_13185 [Saprolegnia parasitica CBS 223.65]
MSAASRGSRVHHIRRTPSPFFTTSSGIVGMNLHEPTEFVAPKLDETPTSSSAFGDGVERRNNPMSQRMDKLSLRKEIEQSGLVNIKKVDVISPSAVLAQARAELFPEELSANAMDLRPIAAARSEHCMYTTSNRVIGEEKGAIQVNTDRIVKPGTFTTSFNGFRYRDYGLNTAVTKSKICDQLDYS